MIAYIRPLRDNTYRRSYIDRNGKAEMREIREDVDSLSRTEKKLNKKRREKKQRHQSKRIVRETL
tara:strand:+ start:239 stop:433 length:195 start_codon:yes stop_codon:yes gene_type:complete